MFTTVYNVVDTGRWVIDPAKAAELTGRVCLRSSGEYSAGEAGPSHATGYSRKH